MHMLTRTMMHRYGVIKRCDNELRYDDTGLCSHAIWALYCFVLYLSILGLSIIKMLCLFYRTVNPDCV
jgi:hypothetical protein